MRLIDADKIGEVSADPYEEAAFQGEIKDQPTIDAIPVEWLKNLQTRYLEAECYMSVCVVNEILNLWRKGNGTDRQEQTP